MKSFLAKINNEDYSVALSSTFYKTKSASGVNFIIESSARGLTSNRVYYHCPKSPEIARGKYLICYRPSKFVSDRLDAFAIIDTDVFTKNLLAEFFDLKWKETFQKLSNKSQWIKEQLKQLLQLPSVEQKFKDILSFKTSFSANLINIALEHKVHESFVKEVAEGWLCEFREPDGSLFLNALSTVNLEKIMTENVLEAIGTDYELFLTSLVHIDRGIIVKKFKLDDFPLYANYADEERFILYLTKENINPSLQQVLNLKQLTLNKGFYEAKLLLSLFELKLEKLKVSPSQIISLLGNFQVELFESHVKSRSKISLKVLPPCAKALRYPNIQSSMHVCEGKVIPDRSKVQDDFYVICQRNKCSNSMICSLESTIFSNAKPHVEYPFYKLVFTLLNISPRLLHSDDQFGRILSAINRWNIILERLICTKCNSPLAISEHSRDSMGKMAVGTTYWHCPSVTCQQYAESIKISYCIDCRKVIDSRIDRHSCTPYNIRSYEKFYICSTCGACCSRHNGNAGICHDCGIEDAYSEMGNDNRTRATCRNCNAPVSLSPFGFKSIQQHKKNGGVFKEIKSISSGRCHLIAAVPNNKTGASQFWVQAMPWKEPVLYVFDLFECLRAGYIEPKMLAKYDKVYDLKVIEKMAGLGLQHPKYGTETTTTVLTKIFVQCISGEDYEAYHNKIINIINKYFERFNQQSLWAHYNTVEHPFILALYNLLAGGFSIDKAYLEQEIKNLENVRNRAMQRLLTLNIYHPDKISVSNYLYEKFSYPDAKGLLNLFERKGAKSLRQVDSVFAHLHQINKTERAANLGVKLLAQPTRIMPVYDAIGTVTGRCTSTTPNS